MTETTYRRSHTDASSHRPKLQNEAAPATASIRGRPSDRAIARSRCLIFHLKLLNFRRLLPRSLDPFLHFRKG